MATLSVSLSKASSFKPDLVDTKENLTLSVSEASKAEKPTAAFEGPKSLFGKAMYVASRPAAIACFYRYYFPKIALRMSSLQNAPEQCRAFLKDIGGTSEKIRTPDGAVLDAMHFDPQKFQEYQQAAFEKWKRLFAAKECSAAAKYLEVNLEAEDLTSLVRLPSTIAKADTEDTVGVVVCQGSGMCYEFDVQGAIMHLLRGKHVVMFNYGGILQSSGSPGWKETCHHAKAATEWTRDKLKCRENQLVVHGKSLGTGPAVWTGTELNVDVIIDRGIAEMTTAATRYLPCCVRPFVKYTVQNFYRYPNAELIPNIKGRVLIIQAENDGVVDASHPERNFQALAASKLKEDSRDSAKVAAFAQKFWIKAPGGHSSKSGGDKEFSWYVDGETHKQLNAFFVKS
jgi:hypothetical protein